MKLFFSRINWAYLILGVAVFVMSKIGVAQQFTIPVLPDTQDEVESNPEMFYSQIKWLVDKNDSLKTPMVLHVGDLVNFNNYDHFEIVSKGFDELDRANIPYALALGNHDGESVGKHNRKILTGVNANMLLRRTKKFNAYFPTYRFTAQRGRMEPDKSDNAYYTFKVGNTNWLVITLEFGPRRDAINWAGEVAQEFDEYNVIIVTHFYLTRDGEIGDTIRFGGNNSPRVMYEHLVKKYPNILLVLSGHTGSSAYRTDYGEGKNKIYSVLQDYQTEDFGGGYIRLLSFDIDKKTISAEMYSPYYNKTKADSSKFVFENVDFLKVK